MESAYERFLFKSCDASKKRPSERRERVSFLRHQQIVNKKRLSTFHGMMFLFHILFLTDHHISKIGSR